MPFVVRKVSDVCLTTRPVVDIDHMRPLIVSLVPARHVVTNLLQYGATLQFCSVQFLGWGALTMV